MGPEAHTAICDIRIHLDKTYDTNENLTSLTLTNLRERYVDYNEPTLMKYYLL